MTTDSYEILHSVYVPLSVMCLQSLDIGFTYLLGSCVWRPSRQLTVQHDLRQITMYKYV